MIDTSMLKEKYNTSSKLLVKLKPSDVGMFRFLLEGYDNLACFTVLDKYEGLLKIFFSPDQGEEVIYALEGIKEVVHLEIIIWPFFEACVQ